MNIREPVLKEELHCYPFLLDYAFNFRDGKFDPKGLLSLTGEFVKRYIQEDIAKKENANKVLESFVKKLVDEYEGKGQLNAVGTLLGDADKLERGEDVKFPISMTNVTFRLKRFGDCLGIRATDGRDSEHENATKILKGMTVECHYFRPFVYCHSITMPRWQAKSGGIDIAAEIMSACRYLPDVKWITDIDAIIEPLLEEYIKVSHQHGCNGNGIEVGQYHGISVRMQIIYSGGKDYTDEIWRRGSVVREGNVLKFCSAGSNDTPVIKYFMQIADENNMFKPSTPGIDYSTEQQCHRRLSKILLDAFSARDLSETIVHNPHWVAWDETEKKPKAEIVAS